MIYLEVSTLADILGLCLVAETSAHIEGRFVEEARPNGRLWWENRGDRLFGRSVRRALDELPWPVGEPKSGVRETGWPQLLRTLGLRDDPARRIGRRVVVRTRDEALFAHIVRAHTLLGQGELRYTSPGGATDAWQLAIEDPSLWCLMQLPEGAGDQGCVIFSESTELAGLYLERGSRIDTTLSLGQLFVSPGELILLDQRRRLLRYRPEWRSVSGIIEVTPGVPDRLTARADARVVVTPRLVPAARQTHSLWHAADVEKLEALLGRTRPDQLDGYEAWFGASETDTWIRAESNLVDRALASELGAMFRGWSHFGGRVYWPDGQALLPRLEPRGQREMFGIESDSDVLVLQPGEGALRGLALRDEDAQPLVGFVRYRAERALAELTTFDSQWELDLGNLVPRATLVESPSEHGRKGSALPANQAAVRADDPESHPASAPATSQQQTELQARITELDAGLALDVRDALRWRERAVCSRRLGHARAGLVAELVVAVLEEPDNLEALALCHREHGTHPELFAGAQDENTKGRLLSETRRSGLSAEESFSLQLCYAQRFGDPDVLAAAVEEMRGGFAGGRHAFHRFEDYDERLASPDDISETSGIAVPEDAAHELQRSIRLFRETVSGAASAGLEQVILKQFSVLLAANVKGGLPVDSVLDLSPRPDLAAPWAKRWQQLEALPELPESLEKSRKLWLETAAMEGVRSADAEQLFVGEVYRPAFTWKFYEESQDRITALFEAYNRREAGWDAPLVAAEDWMERAKSQRFLLYLTTRFGPLDDFAPYVLEFDEARDYYTTIMNCDIYRLSLLFGRRVDEDRFFEQVIDRLPLADSSAAHVDFRDIAENILLCLFLSQAPGRERFLTQLLERTLDWLAKRGEREEVVDELLGVVSYLEAGYVDSSLPKAATRYRFYARLKALWMDHAHRLTTYELKDLQPS